MSARGQTFEIRVTLVAEECCACHVAFGLTSEMQTRLRESHQSFYCPNGHSQAYRGQTEAERLAAKLRSVEDDRHWYKAAEARQSASRAAAERQLAATKGVVTRMRKRAIAGACQFCHRHFANVERHVATKHAQERPELSHD